MDDNILRILNDELMELKTMSKLAQKRLDLHSEELKLHTELLNKHKAGFEILFRNMEKMGKRLNTKCLFLVSRRMNRR